MLVFCMASSMAIVLLPVQVYFQLWSSLPCLALAVLLNFTSFFLSVFIHSRFVVTVQLLQKSSQFFTIMTFFYGNYTSISILFQMYELGHLFNFLPFHFNQQLLLALGVGSLQFQNQKKRRVLKP